MDDRKLWAAIMAASMALGLSACGGGGANSTPPPPPAPTPTPAPTGANSSLMTPLVSESFVNDATTASGTFPSSTNLAAAPTTLTIAYDQTNQSYKVTTQGRSQTFAPANKDASQSSTEVTTFKRVSGTTTDFLTLTNPGTSGKFLYRYVGAGFWQRSVQSTSSISGSFDSFTYGVTTPAASVPRSGSASYTFDILGVLARASGSAPYSVGGDGTMSVDFAAGQFDATGKVILVDTLSGATVENGTPITARGTIGSGTNSLSGSFVYDPQGSQYVGGLTGRFYGPNAEEFGATVYGVAQNQAFPGVLSAALIGRKAANGTGSNLSLLSLSNDQTFLNIGARLNYYTDPASGKQVLINAQDPAQFNGNLQGINFKYIAASQSYEMYDPYALDSPSRTYGPAQLAATQSDARFTEYGTQSGSNATKLRLFKPGAGNPQIALTYSSFGIWDRTATPGSDGNNQTFRTYFTYGISSTAFPRTGTGTYDGVIHGAGASSQPGTDPYDIGGTFRFVFDFGADNISGTFNPLVTSRLTGAMVMNDTYQLVQTRGPLAGGQFFDGSLSLAGDPNALGAFKGAFFGPAVNEIAGTWVIKRPDGANPGQQIFLEGVFIGKKN